jgi:soluble cytochrome b562
MTDDEDLWSDEINAFVDRAFETVTRNPSFYGEVAAYRYAIKLAIDESIQSQTDALKKAREALHYAGQGFRIYIENLDPATVSNTDKGYAMTFKILAQQCDDALAALEQSK